MLYYKRNQPEVGYYIFPLSYGSTVAGFLCCYFSFTYVK
nr:MAG TPA: hypothetical protein [Caudoviricetes sp.]DAR59868.1 MAG TPA: hypothetical protein [Caudoviricetes sp.]